MATTPAPQNIELSVTDFGPIAKAKIDLRPLTVFVGPSNTGKSYMAVLIYALHQFFNGSRRAGLLNLSRMKQPHSLDLSDLDLSDNDLSLFDAWRKKISDLEPSSIELPESVAVRIRSMLSNIANMSEDLENEIARCFGLGQAKNLVRYPSNGETTFSLFHNISRESGQNDPFGYGVTVTEQGIKIDASIPNTLPLQMHTEDILKILYEGYYISEIENVGKKRKTKQYLIGLLRMFADSIFPSILEPLSHPAHYLPADRAGVMHAHQVAVRGLIASASRTVLRRDSPMPVLSGVLGDFLEKLVDLASLTRREPEGDNDLALLMEHALLRGTVRIERSEIDYPSFVYRPDGWEKDLPLMNASSMVSELAPVVLYLRHVVQPGDLLIIEEPESHLHPKMQVAFIRQLAAAVKSGIRILLTTHSEWVLEGLANIVRLSELSEVQRKGIASADFALSPNDVGVWRFESSSKECGSVVNKSLLDVEFGTFPSGFGDISEDAYNEYAEISSRIEDSK